MNENGFDPSRITPDALSGAIAQLTQNPSLLSSIASMIGVPPPQSTASQDSADKSGAQQKDIISTIAPLLSEGIKRSPDEKRRDAFLSALKPYVSGRRAEMIEYILKYGKFGDIIKKLK